jgi:hypothetical protein
MDYLALCQRLRQEASIAGSGPSTVVDQTGKLADVVRWINMAWGDIQRLRDDWKFMKDEFSFDTTASKRDYTGVEAGINDLRKWDRYSFFIFNKATGETDESELKYLSYEVWRGAFRNQMNVRAEDRPGQFTVLNNNSLRLEAVPDDAYTISGEYKRNVQEFTANTDVPTNLPDDFHLIIVWQALMYYASDQNAPEIMDEAEVAFNSLLFRLEIDQLPDFDTDSVHDSLVPVNTGTVGG